MQIDFLKKFEKDIEHIQDAVISVAILDKITEVENAKTIFDISNIKKLKGHKYAYRIRIGSFRIGILIENDIVEFARFIHSKDIYKHFP